MSDVLGDLSARLHGATPAPQPLALPSTRAIIRNGRDDLKPLSTKWRTILTLELRGMSKLDIAAKLGRSYGSIVNITNTVRYREYRDEMLLHCDEEFLNLKPVALCALRGGLTTDDVKTASQNARWYFETLGYGAATKANEAATAEEIVERIFARANVVIEQHAHIHVNGADNAVIHDASEAGGAGLAAAHGRDT